MIQSIAQADPLPSWRDGVAKKSIIEFVAKVTEKDGPEFVLPMERIAVFDNDGTLWSEQPFYFQGLFVFDRVRALAPRHPEWKDTQPFKAVLENDMKTLAAEGPLPRSATPMVIFRCSNGSRPARNHAWG